MEFEWDSQKRKSNLKKHGVDFVAAARMLRSGPHLTAPEARPDQDEMRWRAVGPLPDPDQQVRWSGPLAVVVFTKHDGTYRIISARRASPHERQHYNDQGIRAGPP